MQRISDYVLFLYTSAFLLVAWRNNYDPGKTWIKIYTEISKIKNDIIPSKHENAKSWLLKPAP